MSALEERRTASYRDNLANGHRDQAGAAELALRRHGLDGQRLLKLAARIATDHQRSTPAGLGGKYEDLVSFLTLRALEAAVRYDPNQSGTNYTFSSYLCDVMEQRIPDWYRRKAEGFGDSRHGNNARLVLKDDVSKDAELAADDNVDFLFDLDVQLRAGRISRWQTAADRCHLPVSEWVLITLDRAATEQMAA